MIRSDWLENLGLEMPETVEDIKTVFDAFTYGDPDGNGVDDTYAASFRKDWGWFDGFHGAFDLQSYWWPAYYMPVDVIDGKLKLQYTQQKFKDYLSFMQELWTEGYFDPNSFLNSGAQWGEMWKTGKTGYIHHYSYRAKTGFTQTTREISGNEKATWEAVIPHISGPYGQGSTTDSPTGRMLMITTKAEDPDLAAKYVAWSIAKNDELQEFLKWGVEGKHYIMKDGVYVRRAYPLRLRSPGTIPGLLNFIKT
jgi:putative aldouronate transport system substrate-binding protein